MSSSLLILLSALIIGLLGFAHLVFTFFGPKLLPRDASVIDAMKQTSPVLSNETTIWRAWIGFNASHSIGALLFATTFGYLAMYQAPVFFSSRFLQGLGVVTLVGLLVLAKKYWFKTPLIGIALSLILFVAGIWTQ